MEETRAWADPPELAGVAVAAAVVREGLSYVMTESEGVFVKASRDRF